MGDGSEKTMAPGTCYHAVYETFWFWSSIWLAWLFWSVWFSLPTSTSIHLIGIAPNTWPKKNIWFFETFNTLTSQSISQSCHQQQCLQLLLAACNIIGFRQRWRAKTNVGRNHLAIFLNIGRYMWENIWRLYNCFSYTTRWTTMEHRSIYNMFLS